MSQPVTRATLEKLLQQETRPQVTMYMPTHRRAAPPENREGQTRFKNLCSKVTGMLKRQDYGHDTMHGINSQLESLQDDLLFWESRLECTVFCVSTTGMTVFDIPMDTEEYVAVDDHYHLAPLFAIERDNVAFNVLIVTQQEPRVFTGDMYGMTEVDLDLPHDMREALRIDELSVRQHHYHGGRGHARNGGYATGQNAGSNAQDAGGEERLQYFRFIDEKIRNGMDTSLPLLLVGTTNECTDYRQITKYPHVMERAIEKGHAKTGATALHPEVWSLIRSEIVKQRHDEAVDHFSELKGQDRAVAERRDVMDAAEKGRIDTLFVRMSAITRDTVRNNTDEVPRITFIDEAGNKYVDEVALKAWDQGATVINLDEEHMPESSLTAAALRY